MLPIVDLETGEIVRDTGRSFADLETVIERGLGTVIEVGQALSEIRYRWRILKREAGHSDFDAYCRERWGFSRQRAGQLIDAAEVVALDDKNETTVANLSSTPSERHLRELGRVEPERRAETWQAAVETFGEKVTAADVRLVADELPTNIVDAAYAITDDVGKEELDRMRYRLVLFRSLKAAAQLLAYKPEHVAAALVKEEKRTEIDSLVRLLGKWSSEIDAHQGEGLRLVRGETS